VTTKQLEVTNQVGGSNTSVNSCAHIRFGNNRGN
jgi:hypothetical protein